MLTYSLFNCSFTFEQTLPEIQAVFRKLREGDCHIIGNFYLNKAGLRKSTPFPIFYIGSCGERKGPVLLGLTET